MREREWRCPRRRRRRRRRMLRFSGVFERKNESWKQGSREAGKHRRGWMSYCDKEWHDSPISKSITHNITHTHNGEKNRVSI